MGKKSIPFASRLTGRLTLMEHTSAIVGEIASSSFAAKYGSKLALLVENGNDRAIELLNFLEGRNQLLEQPDLDLELLGSYDEPISALCEELDLDLDFAVDQELLSILRTASSPGRFESERHFKNHLCEGLLLNINSLASKVLAVPYGEYLVSATDVKHTMLIPTTEASENHAEILTDRGQSFELHTHQLIKCWNKLERVIGERRKFKTDVTGPGGGYRVPREKPEAKTGRPSLKAAVDDAGGVSAAAEKTGLSVPAISNDINGNSPVSYWAQEKYIDGLDVDPRAFHQFGEVTPYKFGGGDETPEKKKPEKSKEMAQGQETVSQK